MATQPADRAILNRMRELDRRIKDLEKRSDALDARLNSNPPGWITPTINAASVAAALTGLWIAHRFSIKRQERDEFFKLIQACQATVDEASQTASQTWKESDKSARSKGLTQKSHSLVEDVTSQLSILERMNRDFSISASLATFRSCLLLDIDIAGRRADAARAEEVLWAARALSQKVREAYRVAFF